MKHSKEKQSNESARFKKLRDWKLSDLDKEKANAMPSETVPDDSYSIAEILERFTRGIQPPGIPGQWGDENAQFDDLDLEGFDRLEIPEKVEIATEFNNRMKLYQERAKAQKEAEKAEKEEPPKTE